MIDVKKLVTGFLVLAVAVSASALLISSIGNGNAGTNSGGSLAVVAGAAGTDGTAITNADQSAAAGDNAFLPQVTADDSNNAGIADPTTDDLALASSTNALMSDPNNLTNILTNTYLDNLALTNPDGATTDANGDETLTPPDPNAVISQFESSSTSANLQIPDWDTEADQVPILIVSSSPNAIASYGVALGEILKENIVQTNLQGMLTNNSDPSFEPYVAGKVQTALQDISGLKTPASAAALQKSMIKTLVYAKNVIVLAENASVDPLKTELIMEGESDKYDAVVQDLQTQLQAAQSDNLFSVNTSDTNEASQNDRGIFADIQNIIGIPVANAQIPVTDASGNIGIWATVANLIKAEVKDVVLQIIKNTIIFAMQKTIFAAIQGGSSHVPAFITQWGNTLANAFQQSALNALNSQMVCVGAAPFAPQVRLTLQASYLPSSNNSCAVEFNSQLNNGINNLSKFYNDFSSGSWLTYGSTLQPDNNYYGSVFFTAQAIGSAAQNAQNAAQAKAIANQGFTGSGVCDDGSSPNGTHYDCGDGSYPVDASTICKDGSPPDLIPNGGECADGTDPEVKTPGAIFNGMANSAISGNFQLISSANSWEGLASGLFVSIMQEVLNSLAQTTIAGANGLLQQAANGGGATSVSANGLTVTQGASSPAQITCNVFPDPSGNPDAVEISVIDTGAITSTGITTPSFSWVQPTEGSLSATTGDTVIATFNASGTYQVVVNDTTDNVSQTCPVSIPYSFTP